MKPIDLFQHFAVFKGVVDGSDVPQALKQKVAEEFLHSLPPAAFSTGCSATRQWLEDSVRSVIEQLKADNDKRSTSETPKASEAPAKTVKGRNAQKV